MEGDSPARKVVLVVEDDDAIRKIQRVMLEGAGYSVLEAADGGVGYRMVLTHRPDLVLLDIMMPSVDGVETLRRIRGQGGDVAKTPVLVVTASGTASTLREAMKAGASYFIVKPFAKKDLLAQVSRWAGSPEKAPAASESAKPRVLYAAGVPVVEIPSWSPASVDALSRFFAEGWAHVVVDLSSFDACTPERVSDAAQRLLGSGAKTCLVARPQIFRQAASAGPLDAGGVPLFFTREAALRHMAGCVKRTALFAGRFRNDSLMILLSRLRRGREVHIQHIADLPAARTWLQRGTPWLVALEYASGIADVTEVLAAAGLGGREAPALLVSRTPLAESELADLRGRFSSLRLAWVSDEASEEGVREALRGLRDGA